jgi:hypothetical protein
LLHQIDNPMAIFTGRGRGLGINPPNIMAALFADRHATTSSASGQAASINVVLNWTTAMKED